MKFQAATLIFAVLAFSDTAFGYSSRHLHRRALSLPIASNVARSPELLNLAKIPAPTAPALVPRQNNDAAAPAPAATSLKLSAVPANNTSTATATGAPATGTSTAVGGIGVPAITMTNDADRPFEVEGNTFDNEDDALTRACSIQHNMCADAVNNGDISDAEISDCDDQQTACESAAAVISAAQRIR